MTNSNDDGARRPQAVVAGDFDDAGTLNGRAGASELSIGGPDGRGHRGGGEPLRAAERFARRVHGGNDTAAGEGGNSGFPTSRQPCRTTMAGMAAATPSSAPSGSKEMATKSAPN